MRANILFIRLLLLIWLLLAPGCALAQEAAVIVEEAVKSECLMMGGQLLAEPCAMRVTSPYGTQSIVLRDAPSDSYDAVAMLMVDEEITAVGVFDAFYFVLLDNGTVGWLASDEVK